MFDIQTQGLDEAIKALDARQVERAHVRATNRAVTKGRTAWSKAIRKDYAIKAGDIKKTSRLRKIQRISQDAGIVLAGTPLPLKYFGAKQVARGVSVKIRKKSPRKVLRGAFGPNIDRLGNHVFKRRGAARLPIEKMFSVSVPQAADDQSVIDETLGKMEGEYRKEFQRLLELFGDRL